ncbi:2-amino-4-hydroxy-6-hydroxymethyldihydropteridine diphosphokinase [Dinghuibacter silviterrae]|uniref:2-amino-4-hydroxy-6-hydroxymethyldihydropteridine pyrophosphokinase n=1 Tax=Dinghuibacter silviterrae TaxID=1539049 RepID=A0A4R8DRD5_9BACT|nr:2-amino-4-hydroxy-6-hydroxymethyldihydropteridine diphosphokinase [Dinghuibacter silviterrae]TDX00750.1 2-amino-4-hydroxy-6-hydroxymethyldihydropteridine diphosphokinase [Dinghuibacter silviterrae]
MNEVILLTGGNLGDRQALLAAARDLVGRDIGPVRKASSLYETAPWGNQDQPAFLNQVLIVDTALSPGAVLERIGSIEAALGRNRAEKWGPRLMDIDILFYGRAIIDTAELRVPHPEIANRRFVLAPLAEVAPELVHPVSGVTVAELLAATPDTLEVRRV